MNLKELKSLIIAVAEGLKTTDVEVVEAMLINNIREAMEISVEPVTVEKEVIKEVEKVVEKEIIKEVIPTEVQDEIIALEDEVEELKSKVQELEEVNDDLNSQIKELESDLNDSMTIAETALNDVETLQARCTELHEQNEELLKALNEEEVEELTFEPVEEVSNKDILANNSDDEIDEEEVLKQMTESLDQLVNEDDNEKK